MHAGKYHPALLLEGFVRDVESALRTVRSINLRLQDTGSSTAKSFVLGRELALLMAACPSLETLTIQGYVCTVFLETVCRLCPLLSTFHLHVNYSDFLCMKETILQLPFLFTHLTSLTILSDIALDQLPDMRQSQGIVQLDLGSFEFHYSVQWCCLPPKLRHLKCGAVSVGPPALADGRCLLPDLQSLDLFRIRLPLDAVVQLIRAAPSLGTFRTWSNHADGDICIAVSFDRFTADNLHLLDASNLSFLQDPFYIVNCNQKRMFKSEVALYQPFLPRMVGITRCEIQECSLDDLGPLLSVFPNVTALMLVHMGEMDDVELQVVSGCCKLAELGLRSCSNISIAGLLTLCLRLPRLGMVRSNKCAQLTEVTMGRCQKLLGRQLDFVVTT